MPLDHKPLMASRSVESRCRSVELPSKCLFQIMVIYVPKVFETPAQTITIAKNYSQIGQTIRIARYNTLLTFQSLENFDCAREAVPRRPGSRNRSSISCRGIGSVKLSTYKVELSKFPRLNSTYCQRSGVASQLRRDRLLPARPSTGQPTPAQRADSP